MSAWIAAVALVLSTISAAQTIEDRQRELAAIRAEIQQLSSRLETLQQRAGDLAGELAAIDVEIVLQEHKAAEARAAHDVAVGTAAAAERDLARIEADLAVAQSTLRQRALGLYRLGRQGYLRLLLAAEPGSDVLAAVRWMRFLARRDRLAIDAYRTAQTEVAKRRDELVARRDEARAWSEREDQRRVELRALRRRQTELIARAEGERQDVAARTVALAESETRLRSLLRDLLDSSPALAGTPIQSFRGVLEWPAAGAVSVGFGPRRDPKYRTSVPHNGLEILTKRGTDVRAVYSGRVLYAAPFEGYGPTVVVLHAGKVFSLYCGLEEVRVAKDDVLSLGQTVGVADERLYFEVRLENRPQNPTGWLKPRSSELGALEPRAQEKRNSPR